MTTPGNGDDQLTDAGAAPSAETIRQWLIIRTSEVLGVDPEEVHTDKPLMNTGFDSMQLVVLVGEFEQRWGCRFVDNPIVDYPTIDKLSEFLADQLSKGVTRIDPTSPR